MGRKLRTKIPVLTSTLLPQNYNHEAVRQKEERMKEQQRRNFNRRHAAREAPSLHLSDPVFIRDMDREVEIIAKHPNPRSYLVRTEHGTVRRNRAHLVSLPGTPQPATTSPEIKGHQPQPAATGGSTTEPFAPAPPQAAADESVTKRTPVTSDRVKRHATGNVTRHKLQNSDKHTRETSHPSQPVAQSPTLQQYTRTGRLVKRPEKLNL
ncbi:hypothetical protein BaRGS_00034667 [Batillaria attramentaria]|uniref:Uncharacterized protein n=1 Tax=Batillaria attramentaria TaxID=370345 RepID=A0ABD0JHC8_9CAEN